LLPVLYAVTLFTGAATLFLVQPLVGKLLLPLVGGSPGVWNTCMVFFQAVLLAGYLYAHRATNTLGVRRQALFHVVVLLTVLIAFRAAVANTGSPVPVVASLIPEDQDYPIFGLVALLAVAVGIPFFVLSTSSPLLQRWFAASGHPSARDPYFLYAASNAGSLVGLLGYPLLIEPRLTLAEQQWLFAWAVVGYAVLTTACVVAVVRNAGPAPAPKEHGEITADLDTALRKPMTAAPTAGRVVRWVFLSALPSSLLLGVTTHVSTNLAPVPLLWVVPLALYLVSFILVFARWPDGLHAGVGHLTPVLLLFVALSLLVDASEPVSSRRTGRPRSTSPSSTSGCRWGASSAGSSTACSPRSCSTASGWWSTRSRSCWRRPCGRGRAAGPRPSPRCGPRTSRWSSCYSG
jgi:hypothetical protein